MAGVFRHPQAGWFILHVNRFEQLMRGRQPVVEPELRSNSVDFGGFALTIEDTLLQRFGPLLSTAQLATWHQGSVSRRIMPAVKLFTQAQWDAVARRLDAQPPKPAPSITSLYVRRLMQCGRRSTARNRRATHSKKSFSIWRKRASTYESALCAMRCNALRKIAMLEVWKEPPRRGWPLHYREWERRRERNRRALTT